MGCTSKDFFTMIYDLIVLDSLQIMSSERAIMLG